MLEPKRKAVPGFTGIPLQPFGRLVHYQSFGDIRAAILRKKQIKVDVVRRSGLNRGAESEMAGSESSLVWKQYARDLVLGVHYATHATCRCTERGRT